MLSTINVEDLKDLLNKNEATLIDVREKKEYEQDRIEGSILIPVGQIVSGDKETAELIKDIVENSQKSGKRIAIHCHAGGRSLRACEYLSNIFKDVDFANVIGGMSAWLKM